MSYTSEQWRSAITNLLKMTSMNQIRWAPTQLETGDAWTTIDRSLMSETDDKAYVISQTRSKHFIDEEEYVWQGGFAFSIYEKTGYFDYQKIATAPTLSSLGSLFEAAENNLAFNRNALGGLLGYS